MPEMLHKVTIDAAPASVYDAIATQEGLRQWWTDNTTAERQVGTLAHFGFGQSRGAFTMRIEELTPPKRVVWRCEGGHPEWLDTRLTWDLRPSGDKTKLRFTHSGWRSRQGWYPTCNTTWGALMLHLKHYVEGTGKGPFFEG